MSQSDYLQLRRAAAMWHNLPEYPRVLAETDYLRLKQFATMHTVPNTKNYFGMANLAAMVAPDGRTLTGGGAAQTSVLEVQVNDRCLARFALPAGARYGCALPPAAPNRLNAPGHTSAPEPRPARLFVKHPRPCKASCSARCFCTNWRG